MTASEQAKASGFKSLTQVAEMINVTTQCLRNWHKNEPKRFEIIIIGCKKKELDKNDKHLAG